MSMKLYVGNLAWEVSVEELENLFREYGTVEDAFIPKDRETGRSRGFGFVTMPSTDAENAMRQLDGFDFFSRQIRVNEAAPAGGRGGGGDRRGFGGRGRGGYGDGGYGGGGYGGGY